MSDGEGDQDDFFVFYKDRPDWKDVRPIRQMSTPANVIAIDYSPKFLDVYDYFRAVMYNGEKSHRVLGLTTDAISLNAANYTVWQYRREVLQALGIPCLMTKDGIANKEFSDELDFSRELIEENQKNYQVWHHRKILISWAAGVDEETGKSTLDCKDARLQLTLQELELTLQFLSKDAKNYHAWQHRQWVLTTFDVFAQELAYVEYLLQEDVRNNSAWNQRYFVIQKSCEITAELVNREIQYTWSQILRAPSNESPWSYLAGVFDLSNEVILGSHDVILQLCTELYNEGVRSVPMLSFLLDIYEERLLAKNAGAKVYKHAIQICDMLAEDYDTIRSAYWYYIKNKFQTKFGDLQNASEDALPNSDDDEPDAEVKKSKINETEPNSEKEKSSCK